MTMKETITRTVQGLAKLTKSGAEVINPKPRYIPTGLKRPPTQEQKLKALMNAHHQQLVESQEYADETDFDIDEPDMLTPYERSAHVFDVVPEVLAEQSDEVAKGGEATAEQPAPSSGSEQSSE